MKAYLLLISLLLVAACTGPITSGDLPGDIEATPCDAPRPEICTREYDPVCGALVEGTAVTYKTYSTSCVACSDPAVDNWVRGECGNQDDTTYIEESGFITCKEERPEICTMDYTPVCAQVDTGIRCIKAPCPSSEWRTYGNACAACADPDVMGYTPGECQEPAQTFNICDVESRATDGCIKNYEPVCGAMKDGTLRNFGNPCFACMDKTVTGYTDGLCGDAPSMEPGMRGYAICTNVMDQFKDSLQYECVDACPEEYDSFGSQIGLTICIPHMDKNVFVAWPACKTTKDCAKTESCTKVQYTTGKERVEWEDEEDAWRCSPWDYNEMLIHTSGLTSRDASGRESTAIA